MTGRWDVAWAVAATAALTLLWGVPCGAVECPEEGVAEACRRQLQLGQFYCQQPDIDPDTQAAQGCRSNRTVLVPCFAAPNVSCGDRNYSEGSCVFQQQEPCRYVRGQRYNYYVAVSLSLFLGMLGLDRFYLGYPAIGLVKLCSLGFLFIGHFFDFLLILLQVVGPADRSDYYAPLFGPLQMPTSNTGGPFLPTSNSTCA